MNIDDLKEAYTRSENIKEMIADCLNGYSTLSPEYEALKQAYHNILLYRAIVEEYYGEQIIAE